MKGCLALLAALQIVRAVDVAHAESTRLPVGPLESLNQLAVQASEHRALDFRWDGTLLVVCEQDKAQLQREEMRMRLCWGVKPGNAALAHHAMDANGKPLWKDGMTLGCEANADKCWYRGVLWRGDRKVLGFPPTDTAHFYFDGDAPSALRLAEAFVAISAQIAGAPTPAAPQANPQSSKPKDATLATPLRVNAGSDEVIRTTPRERAMFKYRGCEWTQNLGAYAYRCVVEHGGFNAHWCYDEALEVFYGEQKN